MQYGAPMRRDLLEVLAEPGTGAPLELEITGERGDEIEAGYLISSRTGARFPIVRGIPRFVEGATYTDSFGMQWNRFREVQLDSHTGQSESRQRFGSETGWTEEDLRGRWVLDGGCGAGRFAEIAAEQGARLVALDFSSAVEAAQRTLHGHSNAHVVQGNLLEPPFRRGCFDRVYSIGVVQHTPDPPRVVQNLIDLVKPGGAFCLTIYERRPWTKLNGKYLARAVTRRLPQEQLLRGIEAAMPVLFPLTDALYRIPYAGKLARFMIPVANYVERTEFTHEQRYREAVLDTFDMLSPMYDSPMTRHEVVRALRAAGAQRWRFNDYHGINVVGNR
jgi:SAM-dependent methyltransferase